MKRAELEVLGHHCEAGAVEDGAQINKPVRRRLLARGLLRRIAGGYTVPTALGIRRWRRWRLVYKVALWALRRKWSTRERFDRLRARGRPLRLPSGQINRAHPRACPCICPSGFPSPFCNDCDGTGEKIGRLARLRRRLFGRRRRRAAG